MKSLSPELSKMVIRKDFVVFETSDSVWIEVNARIFFPILNTLEPINNQIRLWTTIKAKLHENSTRI
jgi:hypothetical protein